MSLTKVADSAVSPRSYWSSWPKVEPAIGVLLIGIALIAVPTLISLARYHWTSESGAHGPIIFLTGMWLLWNEREQLHLRGDAAHPALYLLLAPLLFLYVYARSVSMLGTETAALYLILIALGFIHWGAQVMRHLWFVILYASFLIAPPYSLIAELTQPLKIAISQLAVELLHALGMPIAASGVLIQVAQYELFVKQACAGLGSLVTLMALGLFYVNLARPSRKAHVMLLLLSIIPIALLANLLRVIALILVTYFFGDAVAQSFLHDAGGLATFALSMLGLVGLDNVLQRVFEPQSG